jgi:hypothetical protein
MRHGGCGSAGVAVSVPTTFWRRSTAGSDSLSTTTILSQRSTRNSRGSIIRSWHFLPRAPSKQESEPLSPHYARTTFCDRSDGRATGQPQALGLAGFETRGGPACDCAKPAGAGGRVVCPRGASGQGRKAHPELLPSFGQSKAPRAFHHIPARGPSLFIHYQWRDYTFLQSRPSLPPAPADRGVRGSPSYRGLRRNAPMSSRRRVMTLSGRLLRKILP